MQVSLPIPKGNMVGFSFSFCITKLLIIFGKPTELLIFDKISFNCLILDSNSVVSTSKKKLESLKVAKLMMKDEGVTILTIVMGGKHVPETPQKFGVSLILRENQIKKNSIRISLTLESLSYFTTP